MLVGSFTNKTIKTLNALVDAVLPLKDLRNAVPPTASPRIPKFLRKA